MRKLLRPGERVREFVLSKIAKSDSLEFTRLPPMRVIASKLSVSLPTVQQTLRHLAREGKIKSRVGDGSFALPLSQWRNQSLRIGLSVPIPSKNNVWGYRIYGGMLDSIMASGRSLQLFPLSETESDPQEGAGTLLQKISRLDGLICFPSTVTEEICQKFESKNKPVVFLNPPSVNSTTNFVSPDYFEVSRQIGQVWKNSGRRRIAFVTRSPLKDSVSSRLRLGGLINGLEDAINNTASLKIIVASEKEIETSPGILNGGDSSWYPDAIYASGDGIGLAVCQTLAQMNLSIPSKVSVISGSGIDLSTMEWPQMTRTFHPLEKIGKELISMLLQRLDLSPERNAVPGIFISTPFIGGGTTTSKENTYLEIHS